MSRRHLGRARLVALLAVLLGLLGMHGLASAHHPAVATADTTAGATLHHAAAQPGAQADGPDHRPHERLHASAAGALSGALPSAPTCSGDCPSTLAVLCVAVLTSAVAAALLVRLSAGRRSFPRPRPRLGQQPRAPAGADRSPRTPDAVRELCVSRT